MGAWETTLKVVERECLTKEVTPKMKLKGWKSSIKKVKGDL